MTYTCLADLFRGEPKHAIARSSLDGDPAGRPVHTAPFKARQLTRNERRDEDLYAFQSPKERRLVEVIGVPAFCLALLLEFNPRISTYVERPRTLVTPASRLELSFWIQDRHGRERFLLIVPTAESLPAQGGRRTHRRAEALLEAASAASIQILFISEPDLLEQRARIAQALRMLPYVQDVQRLPHRLYLRERVLSLLATSPRVRFSQVEQSLSDFVASDVRAVLCDLIHQGDLVLDLEATLTMNSIVNAGGRHE